MSKAWGGWAIGVPSSAAPVIDEQCPADTIQVGATSVPVHRKAWSISTYATYGYLPSGTGLPPTTAWALGANTRALIPSARRQARSRFMPASTLAAPRTCALGAAECSLRRDRAGRVGADPLAQRRVADAAVDAGLAGTRATVTPARVARQAQRAGGGRHEQRPARVALAGVDAAVGEAGRGRPGRWRRRRWGTPRRASSSGRTSCRTRWTRTRRS